MGHAESDSAKSDYEIWYKMLSGDDANMERALRESEKQSLNMFSVFKYQQGGLLILIRV